MQLRDMVSPRAALALSVLGLLVLLIVKYLRRLYFTPLAKVPGPKLWAISHLPSTYCLLTGTLVHRTTSLHARYGPVVRIAPNEVSFTTPESLQEIYTYQGKTGAFPKSSLWHPQAHERTNSISTANPADHARIRKVLMQGFDGPAWKTQEAIIRETTQQLTTQLLTQAKIEEGKTVVNMTDWLNFCTFDIVGRLGFADEEIFSCLHRRSFPVSLSELFKGTKMISLRIAFEQVPFYKLLYLLRHPSVLLTKPGTNKHIVHINECVNRRLDQSKGDTKVQNHRDLFGVLQNGMEKEVITEPEMRKTAVTLFGGGGGTTGSALAGTVNLLVRYPSALHQLTQEVRTAIKDAEDLSNTRLTELKYLDAVINEGLRLSPPFPCGVPRAAPKGGAVVSGYFLPADVIVSVNQYAAFRSPQLWAEPSTFCPERWLPLSSRSPYAQDVRSVMRPFSVGPRRCPGEMVAYAEMRYVLAQLVLNFDLTSAKSPTGSEMSHWEKQKTWPIWDKHPYYVALHVAN